MVIKICNHIYSKFKPIRQQSKNLKKTHVSDNGLLGAVKTSSSYTQ